MKIVHRRLVMPSPFDLMLLFHIAKVNYATS